MNGNCQLTVNYSRGQVFTAFTYVILVLTAPNLRGITRLSGPEWPGKCWDGRPGCQQSH